MGKEYVVKILNWKKYQNREVKTKSVWFRIQNDFIENPNFAEFSAEERTVWIHALCCASKLNTDSLHVPDQCSHRVLHRCTGIDERAFHRTFDKLKKLHIVEIRTTRGRHTHATSMNADDTLQDGDKTEQDETLRNKNSSSERFEKPLEAVISCFQSLSETFRERSVTEKVQQSWIEAFPDSEWITEEIRKALAWELANPIRRKKNFAAFITRWLTKGWDQRKTAPGGGSAVDWGKVFGKESA